jgi:DNA-binding transcriptional LysR family regulator
VIDGLGVGLLPCWLGDTESGLRRVGPLIEELKPKLWLLTHEDLRRTARIRAFLDFMGKELTRERDLIEGRQPLAPAWGEAATEAAPA